MSWFENTFGFRVPALFSIKRHRNQDNPYFTDIINEEEVYDDSTDRNPAEDINGLYNDPSNPRDAMLKTPNENKKCEENCLNPHNSWDIQPFPGDNFPNLFDGGIGSIHKAMGEIFRSFGGFGEFDIFAPEEGTDIFGSLKIFTDRNDDNTFSKDRQPSIFKSPNMNFNFKSTSISRTVQPDGTIVEKKIYKDSSGAEEETVTTYEP